MEDTEARGSLVQSIVLDVLVLAGLGAQAFGLALEFGLSWALLAVGTEVAAIGVWGAARA